MTDYRYATQEDFDALRAKLAVSERDFESMVLQHKADLEKIEALSSAQAIGQAAGMFKAFMGKNGVARADVEEWLARFDVTLSDKPEQT